MLNALLQYRVDLGGFYVHFIHVKGNWPAPLPLIITHGWPGSFTVKIIPVMTDPATHGGRPEDAFDLVIPSLPCYGFSDTTPEGGMDQNRVAALCTRLMEELGDRSSPSRWASIMLSASLASISTT